MLTGGNVLRSQKPCKQSLGYASKNGAEEAAEYGGEGLVTVQSTKHT